jgi:hypothetical protein
LRHGQIEHSRQLIDRLQRLAREALADRRPSRHEWGQGSAGYAANRPDFTQFTGARRGTLGKGSFLLDATLGLINIQQTAIIKIFSVAAVVFLPPTLVASIYGMNFDFMPELHWEYGYPAVLLVILVVCGTLFRVFRRNQWL